MKKISTILILFSFLGFTQNLFSFEKVAVTSFQFLSVSPLAREMALGGAFTALPATSSPYFSNPANILSDKGFSTFASQTDYLFDTQHFAVSLSWTLTKGIAINAGLLTADYGSMEVTDLDHQGFRADESFNPGLTGEVLSMGAYTAGAGFSQVLTDKFSYGLIAKVMEENFQVLKKKSFAFDLGLLYKTRFKTIQLGAVLKNFGPQISFIDSSDRSYPMPQTMTIGLSGYLIGNEDGLLGSSRTHSLLVSADLVQPRDYDQQYNIGMEYAFRNFLFLRGGYRLNYDTEGLTLGAGFSWKSTSFDYSYNEYGPILPSVHRFAISLRY